MFRPHENYWTAISIEIFSGNIETSAPTLSLGAFTIQEKNVGASYNDSENRHYNIQLKRSKDCQKELDLHFLHLLPGCGGGNRCIPNATWFFYLWLRFILELLGKLDS